MCLDLRDARVDQALLQLVQIVRLPLSRRSQHPTVR